jgi:RNA polymerase sigma-70 factor (ECF subfamily)
VSAEKQRKKIAEFFAKEKNRLVNYVRRWIQDTAERDGEDIVQDVMLNIFDSTDVTAPIENLAAYVYRSLYNRAVDMLRKSRRTVSLDTQIDGNADRTFLDVLSDVRYDAHIEIQKKELRARIFKAVDRLKPGLRAVFIATEFEGRTFRELSDTWDVPIGTLLSRKHRAVSKVKSALEDLHAPAEQQARKKHLNRKGVEP